MSKFRVGVTGFSGFIGTHLIERLGRDPELAIVKIEDEYFRLPGKLAEAVKDCALIIHLAGMNRGEEETVYQTNVALAEALVAGLTETKSKAGLLFASSTYLTSQPGSAFARSKKAAGEILQAWGKAQGRAVTVLIIPNVYGDGGRPFYNSAVATFCHQLTHGEKPQIITDRPVEYIYVNELTELIWQMVKPTGPAAGEVRVNGTKTLLVSELLAILEGFKTDFFERGVVPALSDPFRRNLYNVFLSYVDRDRYQSEPRVNQDERGNLFEIVKLEQGGQVFFSTTKPGVVRGNHYHTRKMEKFCVVRGSACIRLRKVGATEVKEYRISSANPAIVDIPIFHTHHIQNTGQDELLTLFWSNELFDPRDPDTYYEEVILSEK